MIKLALLATSILLLTGCTVAVGGSTVAAEGGYIIQSGNAQELAQCLENAGAVNVEDQD